MNHKKPSRKEVRQNAEQQRWWDAHNAKKAGFLANPDRTGYGPCPDKSSSATGGQLCVCDKCMWARSKR